MSGQGSEARRRTAEGKAGTAGNGRRGREEDNGHGMNAMEMDRAAVPGNSYRRCDSCSGNDWGDMDEDPCMKCSSSWNCWDSRVAGEGTRRGQSRRRKSAGKDGEPFGMISGRPNAGDRVRLCPY